MKTKQIEKYLNKVVTYKTIWDTSHTAELVDIDTYFATFKDGEDKTIIKIFNIKEIK